LTSWIRDVLAEAERRRIAGDPVAQRPALATQHICRGIVTHFLGDDWFDRNALLKSRPGSYFYPRFEGEDGGAAEYTARLFNLAECLFHLQHIENFKYPVQGLMAEDHIESHIAELQIGMILLQEDVNFRYLAPSTIPKVKTPDVEITLGGRKAVADVKCKYEITQYQPGCLKSPFETARKQIGSGNVGFIFIKTPQKWARNYSGELVLPREVVDETRRRLASTSRIVKAIYYLFELTYEPGVMHNRHAVVEINSARNTPGSPWNQQIFRFTGPPRWLTLLEMIEAAKNAE
jgi:hypothetical protein